MLISIYAALERSGRKQCFVSEHDPWLLNYSPETARAHRRAEELRERYRRSSTLGHRQNVGFENLRAHRSFSSFPIWWAFFKILLLVFLPEYFLHSETAVNIFDIHSVLYRFKCNKFTLFFKYFKSKYCIRYYTNFIITKKNEITKFKNYLLNFGKKIVSIDVWIIA